MHAIFKKQLVSAALPCALLALLVLGLFASGREFAILRRPGMDGTAPLVAVAWGIAGVLIGLVCAIGDEARGLREFTLHRGLHRTRILLAQSFANLLALATAVFIVIAVLAAAGRAGHDPLADPAPLYGRLWQPALLSSSAVLGHGLGLACGLMRQPLWRKLFFTFYAGCGLLFLVFAALSALGDRWISNEVLWLALTLGGGVALHALAVRMLRQGVDEERAFAGALRTAVIVSALVIAAPATLVSASLVQHTALEHSARSAPLLGWSQAGWMAQPAEAREFGPLIDAVLFDTVQRQDIAARSEEARYYIVESRRHILELGQGWRHLANGAQWLRSARGGYFAVDSWIGARNGRVLVQAVGLDYGPSASIAVQDAPPELELPYRRELARGDGKPLSQKLIFLPPSDGEQAWLLADAADRTLWSLDLAPALPTLTQVGAEGSWSGIDVAIGRALAELEGASSQRNSSRVVLLTPEGRKSWNGSELVAAKLAAEEVWQSECGSMQRFTVNVLEADALEPLVWLTDGRGELERLEFRHRAPLGASLAAHLVSVLRSPLGSIQSTLDSGARRPTTRYEWRDPLVAGGRRPWLLALNLGLSLAFALWFARRRVHGLRTLWFVLFALFGPFTAPLARALEPRRPALPTPPRRSLRIGPRVARRTQAAPVAS